jgi:hypothetical protein
MQLESKSSTSFKTASLGRRGSVFPERLSNQVPVKAGSVSERLLSNGRLAVEAGISGELFALEHAGWACD